jgi:hypothetical protein
MLRPHGAALRSLPIPRRYRPLVLSGLLPAEHHRHIHGESLMLVDDFIDTCPSHAKCQPVSDEADLNASDDDA